MSNTDEKITAFYCRSAVRNKRLIERQRKLLTAYANKNNISRYKFYIDDGFSGTSMKRPDLTTLLDDLKKEKIHAIVVDDSRLSRSSADMATMQQLFKASHIPYTSLQKPDILDIKGEERMALLGY